MTHSACLPSFGTSNCRQFAENIFDKTKCKNCMKPREDHVGLSSAVVRAKPVHYGWLGLAPPGWSVGAGRRWQRRFFILFDLGTLSWALDDNAGTEPAGSIDLNKPFSVVKAENMTQLPNTICITSKDDGSQILVRSDNSEEFIFWFKSMQKMIADCEEKAKEDRRKKKMLQNAEANRRRHHTVSVTATNSALAEARTSFNRERRHQTMTNSTGGLTKRERPTSLATTIPVQSSAPPTPTGSGLTPAFCRLVSPQALPILENDKPVSPTAKSTSPTGLVPTAYSRAGVDRLGRKDRRVQSSRVTESYNRPYVSSSSTSSYTGRSASVDRRVNYGTEARARTASSDAASPLKASWLSLVNASGFAEAASQLDTSSSNRMWFTLLPNRLIAYASPSSSTVLFELEIRKATVKSYDGEKNKYACLIINSAEKSLTIGALTEKIRRNWIDTLEDAINAKGSRSSSISSSSDQPGADITNLPPKNPPPPSSTRGSSSSITSSSSVATSVLSSTAFSDQNRVPPVFSEITPTAIVRPQEVTKPTSAEEPEITDPLALKVTSRDSPPLRRRRNRDRRDRSKTLDPAEISQIIRRSEFEKASINNFSSPVNAPADDIWKMIQERNPENKAAKIENGTGNTEQLKNLEIENQRLREELAGTCPKSELNELRRKLEDAESEITNLKSMTPPRAERSPEPIRDQEMSLQSQLREIEREIGQNHTRLGALLQRRNSNSHPCRDESSGDGEIFSTPPSSPQPVTNLCPATQSQASIDKSRLKELESDVTRLQLALDDSAAASKRAAKDLKADLSAEKSRRREIEAQNDDLKRRLEASEAERAALASELNAKSERKDDELQRLRAELDGLKKLMSDDLQVAVDSIATRGPFINIDSPLTDVESQILQAIKVQSRLHT